MGIGIWAMHFIGMLASTLPVTAGYDVLITLVSMVPAVLASGVVLLLISRERIGTGRLIVGGILMGAGIGVMRYTGMAAMRMDAIILYNSVLFVVSMLVAVVLSTVALYTKYLATDNTQSFVLWATWATALVMGLAMPVCTIPAWPLSTFSPAVDPLWRRRCLTGIARRLGQSGDGGHRKRRHSGHCRRQAPGNGKEVRRNPGKGRCRTNQ